LVKEWEKAFPVATKFDIANAKSKLESYVDDKMKVEDFNENPPETEEQRIINDILIKKTRYIERAVKQIRNQEVKRIIEYRYIQGRSHAETVIRFSLYCDRTVDRKIELGIKSVANTLLYLE